MSTVRDHRAVEKRIDLRIPGGRRLYFRGAAAYGAGFVPPEEIAGKVRVKGRGGTVLQPGIDLIERAPDFPADGPILIITDAGCDVVRVRPSIGTASDLR